MNAEDIIQLKNWQELTESEKNSIAMLAASEGEYNILKKLLILAAEDADDVPAIDPGVQVNLHSHLEKAKRKKTPVTWWVAAASIIGIIFTALFLKTADHPANLGSSPGKNTINHRNQQSIDSNSRRPEVLNTTNKDDTIAVAKSSKQKLHPRLSPGNEPSSISQLSVAVRNNEALLGFVTEVY